MDAWKIIKVLEEVQKEGGRVTVTAAGDLVRGLGGGNYPVTEGKKRKIAGKAQMDLAAIAGGKVELSKDVSCFTSSYRRSGAHLDQDTERLLIHLVLTGYLQESEWILRI